MRQAVIGGIISKQTGLPPFHFRTIGLRDFDEPCCHYSAHSCLQSML